jgi:hypothetical protein
MKTETTPPAQIVTANGHSIGYLGKAAKSRHGADGLRYRHAWSTGFQDLIFPSHDAAVQFINSVSANSSK